MTDTKGLLVLCNKIFQVQAFFQFLTGFKFIFRSVGHQSLLTKDGEARLALKIFSRQGLRFDKKNFKQMDSNYF